MFMLTTFNVFMKLAERRSATQVTVYVIHRQNDSSLRGVKEKKVFDKLSHCIY